MGSEMCIRDRSAAFKIRLSEHVTKSNPALALGSSKKWMLIVSEFPHRELVSANMISKEP